MLNKVTHHAFPCFSFFFFLYIYTYIYINIDKSIYPRNDSLHNLHSPKSPVSNGSGALDTLMEDLMNSMNEVNNYQNGSQDHCYSCGEEFDYRDDVKNTGNKVSHLYIK